MDTSRPQSLDGLEDFSAGVRNETGYQAFDEYKLFVRLRATDVPRLKGLLLVAGQSMQQTLKKVGLLRAEAVSLEHVIRDVLLCDSQGLVRAAMIGHGDGGAGSIGQSTLITKKRSGLNSIL